MFASRNLVLVLIFVLAASPCLATSGLPDLNLSTATMAHAGPEVLSLMVVPNGSGPGFGEASDGQGAVVVDATIELILRDAAGDPIVFFPWQDMWLESADPESHLAGCRGFGNFTAYLTADSPTGMQGQTQWTVSPMAGGYTAGPILVMVNGSSLRSNAGLPLRFNSPDINGDLIVNLPDVAMFATDYFGAYHFRSDLAHDGVLNIADVAKLARHMGAKCP